MKSIAKDTVFYGLVTLITSVCTYIAFPYYSHFLTVEEFAKYDLSITVVTLITIFVGCGQSNAFQKFYFSNEYKNIKLELFKSGLTIIYKTSFILIILSASIYTYISIFHKQILYNISQYIYISSILLFPTIPIAVYLVDVFRSTFQKVLFAATVITSKLGNVVISITAIKVLKLGGISLIIGYVISTIISILLSLLLLNRYGSLENKDKITFKQKILIEGELFKFGYPFIFVGIASWFYTACDRWMLSYFIGLYEVGVYAMSIKVSLILSFLTISFGAAWSPLGFRIFQEKPDIHAAYFGNMLVFISSCMLAVSIPLVFFPNAIVSKLLSSEFGDVSSSLGLIALSVVAAGTHQVTAFGITLAGKTHLFVWLTTFSAIINLILNFYFIPSLGATGAALATAITSITLSLMYLYYSSRFRHIKILAVELSLLLFGFLIFMSISLTKWNESEHQMVTVLFGAVISALILLQIMYKSMCRMKDV